MLIEAATRQSSLRGRQRRISRPHVQTVSQPAGQACRAFGFLSTTIEQAHRQPTTTQLTCQSSGIRGKKTRTCPARKTAKAFPLTRSPEAGASLRTGPLLLIRFTPPLRIGISLSSHHLCVDRIPFSHIPSTSSLTNHVSCHRRRWRSLRVSVSCCLVQKLWTPVSYKLPSLVFLPAV